MKTLLLTFLFSTSLFAVQPTLFPEIFDDFDIYCSYGSDGDYELITALDEKGEIEEVGDYYFSPCIINEYWGSDQACFKGDGQIVVGYINSGEGSYAFGMGDEEWYERASISEDGNSVHAYFVDGPNDMEEEVHLMDRCNF